MNIILIYFAYKYCGNWDEIYAALERKERVELSALKTLEQKIQREGWAIITILDDDYPPVLKNAYKYCFIKIGKKIFQNKHLLIFKGY